MLYEFNFFKWTNNFKVQIKYRYITSNHKFIKISLVNLSLYHLLFTLQNSNSYFTNQRSDFHLIHRKKKKEKSAGKEPTSAKRKCLWSHLEVNHRCLKKIILCQTKGIKYLLIINCSIKSFFLQKNKLHSY